MPLLLCPNCNVSMQNIQRIGIELDMCPTCRGVWLDRGELEKVLDNERLREPEGPQLIIGQGGPGADPRDRYDPRYYPRQQQGRPWGRYDDDDDDDDRYRGGRRRGFSLFDIFD